MPVRKITTWVKQKESVPTWKARKWSHCSRSGTSTSSRDVFNVNKQIQTPVYYYRAHCGPVQVTCISTGYWLEPGYRDLYLAISIFVPALLSCCNNIRNLFPLVKIEQQELFSPWYTLFCSTFWYRVRRDWMICYETRTYKKHTDQSSACPFNYHHRLYCNSCELHVKNVSSELYCKTADFPQQKCVFNSAHAFFSGNMNGNIYKFNLLCPNHSIWPLDHKDEIKFAKGFTVTTFSWYTLVTVWH